MPLPSDPKARKQIPIWSGFVAYFPDAMAAVAQLSFIANEQHNPGQPLHWAKEKSADHMDAFMRHAVDQLTVTDRDTDGVLHAVKKAWRAMADLQMLANKGENIYAVPPEPAAASPLGLEYDGGPKCSDGRASAHERAAQRPTQDVRRSFYCPTPPDDAEPF